MTIRWSGSRISFIFCSVALLRLQSHTTAIDPTINNEDLAEIRGPHSLSYYPTVTYHYYSFSSRAWTFSAQLTFSSAMYNPPADSRLSKESSRGRSLFTYDPAPGTNERQTPNVKVTDSRNILSFLNGSGPASSATLNTPSSLKKDRNDMSNLDADKHRTRASLPEPYASTPTSPLQPPPSQNSEVFQSLQTAFNGTIDTDTARQLIKNWLSYQIAPQMPTRTEEPARNGVHGDQIYKPHWSRTITTRSKTSTSYRVHSKVQWKNWHLSPSRAYLPAT